MYFCLCYIFIIMIYLFFKNKKRKADFYLYYICFLFLPITLNTFTTFLMKNYSIYKEKEDFVKNNSYIVPKIVWLFWEGNMTNITRYMFKNIKMINKEYKILLLNQNTVKDYIDSLTITPSILKRRMSQQADFYRFNLLYNYGGIWLDAHTFIKNEEYFNNCLKELNENKSDLLAYNAFYHPLNNIEIGVLMAPEKSEFLRRIIEEWKYGISIGRENYMRKRINEGVIIKNEKIYNPHVNASSPYYGLYFFSYVCLQYVLQVHYKNKANIIIKRAEDWFYKYFYDNNNNITYISDRWINDLKERDYPITVFTHNIRKQLKNIAVDSI